MAFGKNQEVNETAAEGGETYLDQPEGQEVADVEAPQEAPAEQPASDTVEVDEEAVANDDIGSTFPEAYQVEPNYKIFVPFEDFEGRINQEDFSFKKDVAVKVTADQANTWLDAKKGYVK